MPNVLRFARALFELTRRSDLPRFKIACVKLSRRLRLNRVARWFFTDLDAPAWRRLTAADADHLKIAVTFPGTYGDKIGLMIFLDGVRRQFPGARLLLFDKDIDRRYATVFRDLNWIDGYYYAPAPVVQDLLILALRRNWVDLVFDDRYAVRTRASLKSRAPRAFVAAAEAAFATYDVSFDQHPRDLDQLSARFPDLSYVDIMARSSGIALDPARVRLPLAPGDEGPRRSLGDQTYVTIHHGSGPTTTGQARGLTKLWLIERWAEVVAHLGRRGIAVYQLGLSEEALIPGADPRFAGRASFHESAALIRGARLHLDTEGGLVHLAAVVGTPAVVVFGPTPSKFFGYAPNVNLQRGACVNCWFSTPDWQTRCPAGWAVPACMRAVTAADVTAAVDRVLDA